MTVQGVLSDTISSLSAFYAGESDRPYPFNGLPRNSIYGDHVATNETFGRTTVGNTVRFGTPASATYNFLLELKLWILGYHKGTASRCCGLCMFWPGAG
jgi:hypothetical protein